MSIQVAPGGNKVTGGIQVSPHTLRAFYILYISMLNLKNIALKHGLGLAKRKHTINSNNINVMMSATVIA